MVTSVAPVTITASARSIGTDPVDTAGDHRAELHEAHVYLESQGLTADYVEAVGHEAESILEAARERSADLIVVGTARARRRSSACSARACRTPSSHGAHCDVLIVH